MKLTDYYRYLNSNHYDELDQMKRVYALTEDIKRRRERRGRFAQTTEEVVEESSQPSELEEAQARAEEFENKYLRAHARNANIQPCQWRHVSNYKSTM